MHNGLISKFALVFMLFSLAMCKKLIMESLNDPKN